MKIVTAIIGPIVESLVVPIKEQMGYVVASTNYVRTMAARMVQLDAIQLDIKNHMDVNAINNLEIPYHVINWLEDVEKIKEEVEKIKEEVESILIGVNGCFNVRMRYKVGKKSSKILEDIDRLIIEESHTMWTDHQKPLGKVASKKASTSTPSCGSIQNNFDSRELIFNNALESLQPYNPTQMIALCGMGGVGKTTMMEQLKKFVEDRKMFDWVVRVVIGQKVNPIAFQQAIADYMGLALTETSKVARADRLHKIFEELSQDGKRKILVILDDVWEMVDLKDIGLSPLPNQGVNFKLLLTSRYEHVCTQMGVEIIFRVKVLQYLEAQNFFYQIAGLSDGLDNEFKQIGEDIIKRCGGLPIAIKIIASSLRYKSKDEWKKALLHLQNHDLNDHLHEIFEMSYNNLKKDDHKEILLLCGFFPEDFDIPVEDLMRYGWGLKLFNEVHDLAKARYMTNTCISDLISANLLSKSDQVGCVRMHDLLRAFVLSKYSEVKRASIVNHANRSDWPTEDTSESYERILLKCTGMSEFPIDLKYPNLTLLKLMDGDKLIKFPEDFYEKMEKLEVLAFESMHTPLPLVPLHYSTKLRTLCLHSCSLMDDLSLLGNLINLEILSFAHCSIEKLPSTIGKLKKLKLLDLTGCVDLHIDDGVLKNLDGLQELYMRVSDSKSIRFTDSNCEELRMISRNLSALEMEFFENKAQPKNVFFKNLKRFMISIGCHLGGKMEDDIYSFKNTLKLVTNHKELLECKIDELFEKTEKLHLQVNDMNDLDVLVESVHFSPHTFYSLRVLDVYKCEDLRYLFTVHVASGLMKLEHLTISSCSLMEVLVYSENSDVGEVKFEKLKFLSLDRLPNLLSLCNTVNEIVLPQLVELRLNGLPNFTSIYPKNKSTTSSKANSILAMHPFLSKEVVIPKLEILNIWGMENLQEIWPCHEITHGEDVNVSVLREIKVEKCDSLLNLFPSNPSSILHHLEELQVINCGSIEVLFNIDLGCADEIKEDRSKLRNITVEKLEKLREVWRLKGINNSHILIRGFQDVESIRINNCKSFRSVFTPTTTNFDMSALAHVVINGGENWEESRSNNELVESSQKINVISNEEISEVDDNIHNVAFPSYLMHTFHNLQKLDIKRYNGVEVVFETANASSRELVATRNNQQPLLLPNLKDLHLWYMEEMSHVWKCNWNELLIPQKQQPKSSFHNLTNIDLGGCHNIKYLFSPLITTLLLNLKTVTIVNCEGIEEVISNRDDEDRKNDTNNFPHLDVLSLHYLPRLERIDGDGSSTHDQFQCVQLAATSWSLRQYCKKIKISQCHALSSGIPSYAVGQMQDLEELRISSCSLMIEVFESQGIGNGGSSTTNVDEGSGGTNTTLTIPRRKNIIMSELPNLKILCIFKCDLLQHVFTFSTLESLKQLKELMIEECKEMKVIAREDGEHTRTSKNVVFPYLKSLELVNLPNLMGFFLGMNDFQWPLLDKIKISDCPQMMVFTYGHSMAPMLNYIHTRLGKHSLECGLNFQVATILHQTPFPSLDRINTCPTLEWIPWQFSNLIEIDMDEIENVKNIIPFNELLQLQNLQKIKVKYCGNIEEVFEVLKGANSVVVILLNLREVKLRWLYRLKYIWKSNQLTRFEFPNLRRVSIDSCLRLEHVFTCSMVGSLLQLQELHISNCKNMEVIVKEANIVLEEEEEVDAKVNEIKLHCLKSIKLVGLRRLKGFCLGKEDFSWPLLDTLEIKECLEIEVFTNGYSSTPQLQVIDTSFGMCYVREDLNTFIKKKQQEGFEF